MMSNSVVRHGLAYRVKRRILSHFTKDRSGASAIEFGIVAAPFFALIMALIEVSLVFFTNFTLENAVD